MSVDNPKEAEDAQFAADLIKADALVAAYQQRLIGREPHVPVTFCIPAGLEERSAHV